MNSIADFTICVCTQSSRTGHSFCEKIDFARWSQHLLNYLYLITSMMQNRHYIAYTVTASKNEFGIY